VESTGITLTAMPNLQRWTEIQQRVNDVRRLDDEKRLKSDANWQENSAERLMKVIATLNLVTTGGSLRARRSHVTLALCDQPDDTKNQKYWESVLDELIQHSYVIEHRQLDEIRIWQGSEFDLEGKLAAYVAKEQTRLLSDLLQQAYPLHPVIAQRHSHQTGTLRIFELSYQEQINAIAQLTCSRIDVDGALVYWVGESELPEAPETTADGKPLVILTTRQIDVLRSRAIEFSALKNMLELEPQMQTDKVASREIEYRLLQAEKLLYETIERLFNPANDQSSCWVQGQRKLLQHAAALNSQLSDLCDRTYNQAFTLWNELINRRDLTSQGAKARRLLLEAMLEATEEPQLGLKKYGLEVTMYASVLKRTGIHRQENGQWGIYPPTEPTMQPTWEAIATFCRETTAKPKNLSQLYEQLEAPPFGLKRGVLPVLIAAVLIHDADDVSVYKDGTFIPILGSEHFELLVKDPSRFSVKYVQMDGLRVQVFRQLEEIILNRVPPKASKRRNATLLSVVEILVRFAEETVHPFTQQTRVMSNEAQAVLKALLRMQEPDELLFQSLPIACGLPPLVPDADRDDTQAQAVCDKLINALREIRDAYEALVLNKGRRLLIDAFETDDEHWRHAIRERSRLLVENVIDNRFKQFLKAAIEEDKPEQEWLEALLFVIVDKPLTYWVDADLIQLEINLALFMKQMITVEVLKREVTLKESQENRTFRAFKLTLTANNGNETDDIVILEREHLAYWNEVAKEVLKNSPCGDDPQKQKILAVTLLKQILRLDDQSVDELAERRSPKPESQENQSQSEAMPSTEAKPRRRKRSRSG
jgi:hypothetical protein